MYFQKEKSYNFDNFWPKLSSRVKNEPTICKKLLPYSYLLVHVGKYVI